MIKSKKLERGNIKNIVGAVSNDYLGQIAIVPAWKRGMSNYVYRHGSYGDNVIGFPSAYEVDGDLLFTVGWGDGFSVQRLNDDGTFTRIFGETYFLYRDTTSVYHHMQSIAIDKVNKKGVAMTYNVDGYTTFDYSGCLNGGTNFVKDPRPSHQYPQRFIGGASNAVNLSSVGLYYTSGLVSAGEWIYAGEYDARHYQKYPRRNLRTGEEQLLTWEVYGKAGTANDDRNGYRQTLFYDDVNDRVFFCDYYGANFMMVEKASTESPELVWCDMGDAGMGSNAYEQALFIPDPVNQPNLMYIGATSRIAYIDITPCFTGAKPTVLKQFYTEDANRGAAFNVLFRAGTKYQSTNGDATDKIDSDPYFCPTSADRGRNMLDGWIDFDNSMIVGVYRHDNTTEDTVTGGRGRSYRADYSSPVFKMYSTNGIPYWIKLGYSYDGNVLTVWDNETGRGLIGSWEVEYGTYTLDNSSNIDFVHLSVADHYAPSGCSLSYYVSNNDGATWEAYSATGDNSHTFSSQGNKLRIKYVGVGQETKAPYKMSSTYDYISYGTLYESVKDATVPYKVTRKRIRGKKS